MEFVPLPRNLTLEQIIQEMEAIQKRDDELDDELHALLREREVLEQKLEQTNAAIPLLDSSSEHAHELFTRVDRTAVLAHNIVQQVRDLDAAQLRLQLTIRKVEQAMDVKNTLSSVQQLLDDKKYEEAANCIYRVLHQPQLGLNTQSGSNNKGASVTPVKASSPKSASSPSTSSEDPARAQLVAAELKLHALLVADCQAAQRVHDHKAVFKLAPLFALIDDPLQGLQLYSDAVRQLIREDLQRRSLTLDSQPKGAVIPYLDVVTGVLDRLSAISSHHCAMVEKLFSVPSASSTASSSSSSSSSSSLGASLCLLRAIQSECDAVLHPLLQRFVADRQLASLVAEARSRKRSTSSSASSSSSTSAHGENDPLDPRKIDALLEELAFLTRESELFDRDLRQLAKDALEHLHPSSTSSSSSSLESPEQQQRRQRLWQQLSSSSTFASSTNAKSSSSESITALVHVSKVNEIVQELIGQLITLEEYCLFENVHKAIEMDEPVVLDNDDDNNSGSSTKLSSQKPVSVTPVALTTSMVDDVFYLLKKSAERAFSTCNVSAGCAVLNHINGVLTRDYKQSLESSLRTSLEGASGVAAALSRNLFSSSSAASSSSRVTLPLVLNNLEVSARYTIQLREQIKHAFEEVFNERADDHAMVKHCLDDVNHSATLFRRLLDDFFGKVASVGGIGGSTNVGEVISRRIKHAFAHWAQLSYELSEADYAKVQNSAAAVTMPSASSSTASSLASSAAAAFGVSGLVGGSVGSAGSGSGSGSGDGLHGHDGSHHPHDILHDDDNEDDEEQAAAMALRLVSSEHVAQAILISLDRRLRPLKAQLTEENFDQLSHSVVQFLVKRIEDLIMKKKFTFWGGLQLDKDVRNFMNYFSTLCHRTVRDKFSRLVQVCSVVQLEKVTDINDYFSDNREMWRLDASEVKKVLALRVDFTSKAIAALRF